MQLGNKQFINLVKVSGILFKIISGKNILYLTVINLDPESRKVDVNFKIDA